MGLPVKDMVRFNRESTLLKRHTAPNSIVTYDKLRVEFENILRKNQVHIQRFAGYLEE